MKKNKRRGQILIMTTLLLIPMLGVLGMVTDLGYMRYIKMTTQSAAEAAAIAAMIDFHSTVAGAVLTCDSNLAHDIQCTTSQQNCDPSHTSDSIHDGCKYGEAHGFTDEALTFEANTNSTPPTAPGIGTASYWITFRAYKNVPQLFSAVLGNYNGLVVGRSTVAIVQDTACIYALDPTMVGSISVGGTASLTSSCGIYDDSSANCAMATNGGGQISAPSYDVVGTACTSPLTPSPNQGVAPATDPLAALPAPNSSYPPCQNYPNGGGNGSTINLSPGVYCGGIQVKNNTVVFAPGTYVMMGGGLSTQDTNSHIVGAGVTFYNTFDPTSNHSAYSTYQPININANSTVNLTAAATGTYAGMLFFDDRNAPTNTCGNGSSSCADTYGGGSAAIYTGMIYSKNNCITMYGNSSVSTQYSIVVADCINLVGTTAFNNNYSSLPGGVSPLQKVSVVE